MSITSDIRSYADTAIGQSKQVVGQTVSTAAGLRAQAEKAVNLEAIKAAVEPYLAQARNYSAALTDRAEDLFSTVKDDKRVGGVVTRAETLTGAVVETVQARVLKPVQSLTGLGGSPKIAATKPAPTPAVTKPAGTVRKAPAKKAAARKAGAK
jgi:hypothetical protein